MGVRSSRALGHLCRRKTVLKVISLTDGDISCSPLIIYHGNKLIANYKMAGAGIVKRAHMRSVSEPALRVSCSGYSRERTRLTDLAYERGKDNVAHWIGAWNFEEVGNPFPFSVWGYIGVIIVRCFFLQVCAVLQSLVARCPLNQLEYLWTVSLLVCC